MTQSPGGAGGSEATPGAELLEPAAMTGVSLTGAEYGAFSSGEDDEGGRLAV